MLTKRLLLWQQGYCCNDCGKELFWDWTVDHKTALADGGHPTDADNLQILDQACHRRKTRREQLNRRMHVSFSTIRRGRRKVFWKRHFPSHAF
jgi:5-methylcytosine-specific restriction endonuclease McrA